ncbi:MAG: hypothetical protein JW781_09685, partial [Deltaproteobacteria bacterium]|nr:hypothetical protein [Candidatus Anaeroferrophillacea bacterium]
MQSANRPDKPNLFHVLCAAPDIGAPREAFLVSQLFGPVSPAHPWWRTTSNAARRRDTPFLDYYVAANQWGS